MNHTSGSTGRIAALLALLLFVSPATATAQGATAAVSDGEISRLTVEISNEIYSPFCPGKTLMMCPSPNAAQVRRDVQDLLREGKDKETIKAEIIATYGDEFKVVEPPPQDNIALLIAVVLGLLVAIGLVAYLSKRTRGARGSAGDGAAPPSQGGVAPVAMQDDLSDEERAYLDELRRDVTE